MASESDIRHLASNVPQQEPGCNWAFCDILGAVALTGFPKAFLVASESDVRH